jgi:hypothetical protein
VIDNVFDHLNPNLPAIVAAGRLASTQRNCQSVMPGCGWTRPTGQLTWGPCTLRDAMPCGAIIQWRAENLRAPLRLVADGREVIAQLNAVRGKRVVPSVSSTPKRFDLYSGGTLLDSIELVASGGAGVAVLD